MARGKHPGVWNLPVPAVSSSSVLERLQQLNKGSTTVAGEAKHPGPLLFAEQITSPGDYLYYGGHGFIANVRVQRVSGRLMASVVGDGEAPVPLSTLPGLFDLHSLCRGTDFGHAVHVCFMLGIVEERLSESYMPPKKYPS